METETSPRVVRHLIIAPSGEVTEHREPLSPKYVMNTLGGNFKTMVAPDGAVALFPFHGGMLNWVACEWLRSRLHPEDRITGPVIVLGGATAEGMVTDVIDGTWKDILDAMHRAGPKVQKMIEQWGAPKDPEPERDLQHDVAGQVIASEDREQSYGGPE